MSLGKVNEFGIFEPIFEPEPDSGNGISTGTFPQAYMMSELSTIFFQLNAPVAYLKLWLGKPGLICLNMDSAIPQINNFPVDKY